ncbi:hypothetical protein HMPREF9332_00246 [Alloprevotella rava F0323]|uniref:Uncharacterized protein n=1 Tax=Alloprevotella rava F0323 TaxID=679199 RepID=G5G9J5_9BACT|nr:tetratricopeptide repeat protein [Alloprevotella rava]EHG24336.1 hypothetical protein HMPREF9332_00246 [Alloprevotella rava F0323]
MKSHFYILLFWLLGFVATMAQKQTADSLYAAKNYVEATRIYEADLKKSPNVAEYNNLGNAYYRQDNLPHAILNYQRALRLEPANADIRHSLELSQIKLQDKFDAPSEMFFFALIRNIRTSLNPDAWALWGLSFLFLAFVVLALFRFVRSVWMQKVSLFSLILVAILSLASLTFAYQLRYQYYNKQLGVVMKDCELFDGAVASTRKLRTLHEGVTVEVSSESGMWLQVLLPDGTSGWLEKAALEKV